MKRNKSMSLTNAHHAVLLLHAVSMTITSFLTIFTVRPNTSLLLLFDTADAYW